MSIYVNRHRKSLRLALALTVAAAIAAASPAMASACDFADLEPRTAAELDTAARATHCLVNEIRRDNGLRGLKWNKRLVRSSDWQADDMLGYGYFDHARSDGPSFNSRIRRFGYAKRSRGYMLGENIAWGTAADATPQQIVDAWMDSSGHRANILRRKFREDGIAIVRSEGEADGDYADWGPVLIYVHQFGKRY